MIQQTWRERGGNRRPFFQFLLLSPADRVFGLFPSIFEFLIRVSSARLFFSLSTWRFNWSSSPLFSADSRPATYVERLGIPVNGLENRRRGTGGGGTGRRQSGSDSSSPAYLKKENDLWWWDPLALIDRLFVDSCQQTQQQNQEAIERRRYKRRPAIK